VLHRDARGKWQDFAERVADQPFVLMIAGPNGSGKTTLTNQLRRAGIDFGHYINPDEIAVILEGDYGERVRRAQAMADARRAACLLGRESFSFETVMSHPSKVDVLRDARRRGFRTLLYFVATESAALNVARVRQRVALGGHDVPEDRIRARYARTLALLPDAIEAADDAVLFDNSYGRPTIRPFFRRRDGVVTLDPPTPNWAAAALKPYAQP
jgi:predicted ABC-type ATPase